MLSLWPRKGGTRLWMQMYHIYWHGAPRSHVNIVRDPSQESQAIQAWLDVNPEAHFIPLPGSEGANFLLLPEYFAIG